MIITMIDVNDYLIKSSTREIYLVCSVSKDKKTFEIKRLCDDFSEVVLVKDYVGQFNIVKKTDPLWLTIDNKKNNIQKDGLSSLLIINEDLNEISSCDAASEDDLSYLNLLLKEFNETTTGNMTSLKKIIGDVDSEIKEFSLSEQINNPEKIKKEPKKIEENKNKEEDCCFSVSSFSEKIEDLVLYDKTKEELDQIVTRYELRDLFDNEFNIDLSKKKNKCLCLNFYGPPGTGKTLAVRAISSSFKKDVLVVDFAQLISKWVGETGKNIKKYFEKAQKENLILFFDEADALLQKRLSEATSSAQSSNKDQNIFMQELDRFDGIVALTTNLFKNYDEAMLRRMISVEFPLPSIEMRQIIIEKHIPFSKLKFAKEVDAKTISMITEGFSGGDIKFLVEKVLMQFASNTRKKYIGKDAVFVKNKILSEEISYELFFNEIEKIKRNKGNYSDDCRSLGKISLI